MKIQNLPNIGSATPPKSCHRPAISCVSGLKPAPVLKHWRKCIHYAVLRELLGELVSAALEELAASLPYVKGSKVIATDEQGFPVYEDIGPTPRFLALTHKHMQALREISGQRD